MTPSPNLSHCSAFTFLSAALGLVDSHAGAVCAGFSFHIFFPHLTAGEFYLV